MMFDRSYASVLCASGKTRGVVEKEMRARDDQHQTYR